nr:hypothetical protein FVER53263_20888 [Fusarium verticillioides]
MPRHTYYAQQHDNPVEAAGYACRAISASESPDWTFVPYAIQTFAFLLGPSLITASIYMILSKIIISLDADIYSLVPVKVIPRVFIFGDMVSLAAQFTGAGILINANSISQQRTAQLIIIGGLAFQVYFFGFFTSVLHIVHSRIIDNSSRRSINMTIPWKRWIIVLYIACGLVIARSVYRVIEYATGPLGILQATEIYFYVFDAGFIFLVTLLLNIFHPRQLATVSSEDLTDVETVIVTPSKPPPQYQPPRTPPKYPQPLEYLPSYANLRNRGPCYHYPQSPYRTQSYIQYPPPLHYYQLRRPPTLAHHRPRTNRTYKSFNTSLSSSSSFVSIYNPQTGQYEPFRR